VHSAHVPVDTVSAHVPVDTVSAHVPVDTVSAHVPVDTVSAHVPVDTVRPHLHAKFDSAPHSSHALKLLKASLYYFKHTQNILLLIEVEISKPLKIKVSWEVTLLRLVSSCRSLKASQCLPNVGSCLPISTAPHLRRFESSATSRPA
jgi:hypothetical protein